MQTIISRIKKINRLFAGAVLLPTLLTVLYFGIIASDIYISESSFVIRTPDRQTATTLGMLLQGSGFNRSQDDSYSVLTFVHSRDALGALDKQMNLRQAFGKGDVLSRFPGLDLDDSFEELHRYFKDRVSVQFDPASAIATLSVRAFTAAEAQQINQQLLGMSEELVNRLNERGRQDLIRFVSAEVAQAEARAKRAASTLAQFRNEQGVINPEQQSIIPLQQIAQLQNELIATRSQLSQLQQLTKENPQIPVLQSRVAILEAEIERESVRVTGGSKSLASKAAQYQMLALDKEFADKQLASTLVSLEQARNQAQRQQLYLERIAQPSLPDAAMEPRRIRAVLAVFIIGLIAWGVLSLLVAGVKEHQD
jgi:capsular polysaccharide transport system permease protein